MWNPPRPGIEPFIGRQFLNHWTSREVLKSFFEILNYATLCLLIFNVVFTQASRYTHTKPLQVWDCLPLTPAASHSASPSTYFSILTAMVWQGQYCPFCSPRNRSTNCISLCRITLIVPVEMWSYMATFYLWSKYNESVMAPCHFISSFFIFFKMYLDCTTHGM